MPVNIQDRPIEAVREQVIDQLIMNYSHGEISLEAFERRLDEAMTSQSHQTLQELTADLTLTVDQSYVDSKQSDLGANYSGSHGQAYDRIVSVLGDNKRHGPWTVAKQTKITSIMSNVELDFTDAQFSHPEVHIQLFSLFSKETIYVPDNVNVVSKVTCIASSIENKTLVHAQHMTPSNAPTIYIEGYSIFSDLKMKLKRTVKEKFVVFADKLKRVLS